MSSNVTKHAALEFHLLGCVPDKLCIFPADESQKLKTAASHPGIAGLSGPTMHIYSNKIDVSHAMYVSPMSTTT